ncbi:MAG: 50S ribosomal protein L30e [archaeon]|nr:50S ribosomal protein L30e [archaeon]
MSKRGKDGIQKAKRRKRSSKKKEFDINKLVNIAVKTGDTIIGTNTLKKYINTNDLKLIILANNCPIEIKSTIETLTSVKEESIPIYTYPFSSWDLGTAAGKPFMVTAMGIINAGDSTLLDAIQKIKA